MDKNLFISSYMRVSPLKIKSINVGRGQLSFDFNCSPAVRSDRFTLKKKVKSDACDPSICKLKYS